MIKAIIAALILAACSSEHSFPTNTAQEAQLRQDYRDGKITYSEYQEKLKEAEKKK